MHPALPCPTVGLEFVWYARDDLVDLADPVAFQLNVNGGTQRPSSVQLAPDGFPNYWSVLDLAAARQVNLEPTGHASRGVSGPPSPTTSNFYLAKGKISVDELIGDIKSGLYITDLIGFGVNGVTGDYSRGASGFWIENGKLAWPVSGITVAGNLKDMFLNMTPASDLQFKSSTNAPTVRIEGMTVAGS